MEAHRKLQITPDGKTDKRHAGKYETTEEFLARGGKIDVLPSDLDKGYDIKARMGDSGGLL